MAEVSPFNPITGEASTIHSETRSIGPSSQKNELSPVAIKALAQQKRSEAGQLEAMLGGAPIQAQPTPEELDANLASQDQSARVVQKDPTAPVVSPPEPTSSWGELPTAPIPETPRFTSQQLNQSVDATRPQTAVAQRDEIAADEAATKQRLFQQELAQREAVAKQVADMQAKLQADIDKASAEYSKTASLSREQVTPLMMFAAGLGAMGAARAGTPNFANDNINKAMDRALEEKKALMHAGIQKLEGLRARPAQIEKFREQALADIMAKQKAEVELMGAASAKMMARFPQSADALRAKQAELQAGFDKEYAQYIGTRTARQFNQEAPKVTDTSASGKNGRPTPSNDVQNFEIMKEHGKMAERLQELIKKGHVPTPEQRREYDQNENMILGRLEAEEKGGKPSVIWSGFMRSVGALPESTYPEGASPEIREYLDLDRAMSHFSTFKFSGQTGVSSPVTRHTIGGARHGGAGEPQEDAIRKDMRSSQEFIDAAKAAEELSRVGEKESALEARKAKTEKLSLSSAETEALKWARDNPGPKADAIKAKIRKDKGIK